jgi:hypothetical protein
MSPGSPGWLPIQGPHRPARADFPHAVLQTVDSLLRAWLRPSKRLSSILLIAIHRFFVPTTPGSIAPSVFPTDGSTVRCSPSLHWVSSGQVPLLHRYYEDTTSLAALSPRFVSFTRAIPFIAASTFVRSGGLVNAPSRRPGISYGNSVHFRKACEPTRPPRFLDDPPHICPVLGPRSSRCVRPLRYIDAAPVIVTTKASVR